MSIKTKITKLVFITTSHRGQEIYTRVSPSFTSICFFVSTDKTLALSHHHCGGNVSLDQEDPAGHINLTLPGLFTDANRLNPMSHQSDKNLSRCTWMIDVPLGRTVLLKVVRLESGSSVSVLCVWKEEDHNQVLESGGTALLSGCDRNKATLTWSGPGHSSDEVQLSYYGEKLLTQLPRFSLLSQCGPLACTCTQITRV